MTTTFEVTAEERREIVRQIGRMNVFAISGGRIYALPDGIEMPAGSGYRVRVRLTANDDYTVERVFVRGRREFDHGTRERVYCDQVGEAAYRASCFRSYDADTWPRF